MFLNVLRLTYVSRSEETPAGKGEVVSDAMV